MALIKLGGLAQDVRGTLNGTVFSRNRGGAYTRTKVSPVQPITPSNTLARSLFGIISKRWSATLTDAQRAAWDAFAAVHPFINVFGDAIILSGVAFYQAVNRRAAQCGIAFIDDAPPNWDVTNPVVSSVTCTSAGVSLISLSFLLMTVCAADETIYLFGTPPILGARTVQRNNFRLINQPDGSLYDSGDAMAAPYSAVFNPLPIAIGARLSFKLAILNTVTGACSTAVNVDVIVAA